MKFSELERKIKSEADRIRVPDVYAGVKKSSIRKLDAGQAPFRAFRKDFAIWTLILTLAIFATLGVCLFVFWLTPSNAEGYGGSFISVTVTSADGESKIDLFTDKGGGVTFAYNETEGAPAGGLTGILPEAAAVRVLSKPALSVRVAVLNDSDKFAGNLAGSIKEKIEAYYGGEPVTVRIAVSDEADKESLVELIRSRRGEADIDHTIDRLILSFTETFETNNNY